MKLIHDRLHSIHDLLFYNEKKKTFYWIRKDSGYLDDGRWTYLDGRLDGWNYL